MTEKDVKPESEGKINSEPDKYLEKSDKEDGYERQKKSGGKVYDEDDKDNKDDKDAEESGDE